MPHVNHRRGDTRRRAQDYPYTDATRNRIEQNARNRRERREGRRLAREDVHWGGDPV